MDFLDEIFSQADFARTSACRSPMSFAGAMTA